MSNKSGIGSNIISLPKGGGAQGGMGESFSPDLFTGTGNYSVPIGVPTGRNGFQPQLSLGYSTGNGNSPFGLGWGLSVPGVSRKTNRGIPVYDDDKDVFVLTGAEDLVLLEKQSNTSNGIAHHEWQYRPRTEGLFARILHHQYSDGRDYWEVKSKNGLTSYYGSSHNSGDAFQLSNPAVPDNIFAWQLSKTEDLFGNKIEYSYERVVVNEQAHHAVQHYLKSIHYVNYQDAGSERYLCSVQFHYSDRPDAFSSGRAGFEVRTTRRCTAITTHTHPKDADLPAGYAPTVGGNTLLNKRYELRYQDELGVGPLNGVSLLAELVISSTDKATGETESMPPLSFGYTEFSPEQRDLFPLQGKALPSQSLGAPELELADLNGNGLPDFVEVSNQGIRYWKNQGNGRFSVPKTMRSAPAFSLADPEVQLMDANGDGRIDLMVSKPGINGYFSLDHQGNWDRKAMKRYQTAPSFSFADPEVKLLDLDGNGITDVLRSGSRFEHFYQSSPTPGEPLVAGWVRLSTTNRSQLASFPNVNFSNPQVKLADMSGDGLQDIVQVQNGTIWYWPNLGHGQWGKRRTMRGNGRLFPSGWDPQRVLLGDVVGDGLADMIYIENGKIHLWINQSGNRWSEKITIKGTPNVYNADGVRLVDLLGTGVSGLLWTYDANTGNGGLNNSYFLDFTARVKPYVMSTMNNNKGAITKVTYESSVISWMRDNATPNRRWKTNLPFPVQVIAKTEVIDEISGGKLVTQFQYSHGYWDGHEREFRGFARVEQQDTESFERYNANAANAFKKVDLIHYSPPSKTVNWFHLGGITSATADDPQKLFYEADFTNEYWAGDSNLLSRSAAVELVLAALPQLERRDAFRALRGSQMRSEIYAADQNGSFDSPVAQKPFTVTETQFGVRQEAANLPTAQAIFFAYSEGSRTTDWERSSEPKTTFSFTAEYDAYGQAKKQINIAVPRGINPQNGYALPNAPHIQAGPFLCTSDETNFIYEDSSALYLCDRVSEQKTFEITYTGHLSVFALRDNILAGNASQKIMAHSLAFYDGTAFTGLPLGSIGQYGVVSRSESLYSTLQDIDAAFDTRPELFKTNGAPNWDNHPEKFDQEWPNNRAGYEHKTAAPYVAGFYVVDEQNQYDVQSGTGNHGLITAKRDAFNNETNITFDAYHLLPKKVTDKIGMETSAELNYRLLQTTQVTDPNENVSASTFSPLGLLKSSATMGASENEGDTLENPGSTLEYDFNAWYTSRQPIWVKTKVREHHVSASDDTGATQITVEYSDGFGRLLQTRKQAEDTLYTSKAGSQATLGDAGLPYNHESENAPAIGLRKLAGAPDNVVVNGYKVYNNKGKVVEQFEPYFDQGFAYKPLNFEFPHTEALSLGNAVNQFITQHGEAGLSDSSLFKNELDSQLAGNKTADAYYQQAVDLGILRRVLDFGGDNDVDFGLLPHTNFGTGDFTFSVWVKPETLSGTQAIFGNQVYSGGVFAGFNLILYKGRFHVYLADSSGGGQSGLAGISIIQTPTVGEWQHLCISRIGNNSEDWVAHYNGAPTSTKIEFNIFSDGNINTNPVGTIKVGSRRGSYSSNYFKGKLAGAQLYERSLNSWEAKANYDQGIGNSPAISTGLVFSALLNEYQTTLFQDSSVYRAQGTLSGNSHQFTYEYATDWQQLLPPQFQKVKIFHDALGRPLHTLNPDGTAQLNVYGIPTTLAAPKLQSNGSFAVDFQPTPWENYAYDPNDLGGETHPSESSNYSAHWNTPTSNVVDALGRTLSTTTRLDNIGSNDVVMQYSYDIQGRLLQVTDPMGRVNFSYSHPTAATESESSAGTPPGADAFKIVHLDSGTRTQLFDARGQSIEQEDQNQNRFFSSFDYQGKPLKVWTAAKGENIRLIQRYTYGDASTKGKNQFGMLVDAYDETGYEALLSYDFKGNILSKFRQVIHDDHLKDAKAFTIDWAKVEPSEILDEQQFETNYTYDGLNRVSLLILPTDIEGSNKEITPFYNRAGDLVKVSLDGEEYVQEIAYNAKGQRLLIAFGNGLMTRYAYSETNARLLRMKTERFAFSSTTNEFRFEHESGTTRQDLTYEYDLSGNILKKKNRTPDCGIANSQLGADALDCLYTYDGLSRLISATGRESSNQKELYRWIDAPKAGSPNSESVHAYERRYEYDKVGNILRLRQLGAHAFTRDFSYAENTLKSIAAGETTTNFHFDEKGNLTQSGESRHYTWNEKDQLVFFKVAAGEEPSIYAHYLYDASGVRTKKIVWDQQGNKEVTVYLDGVFEYRLKQEDGQDKEQNIVHVMDDSKRIAQLRIGEKFEDEIEEEVVYNLDDHLGGSACRVNQEGSLIDRQEYYPFGDSALRTFAKKRYQYLGKEKDAESGLYYYGARYYAAWTGRFISVDPLAGQYAHLNPFNNAGNKVINAIDIDGLQSNVEPQTQGGGDPAPLPSTDENAASSTTASSGTEPAEPPEKLSPFRRKMLTTRGTMLKRQGILKHWKLRFDPNMLNIDTPIKDTTGPFQFEGESLGIDSNFQAYDSADNYIKFGKYAGIDQAGKWFFTGENTRNSLLVSTGVIHDKREQRPNVDGNVFRYNKGGTSLAGLVGKKLDLNRNWGIETQVGGFVSLNDIKVDLQDGDYAYENTSSGKGLSGGGIVSISSITYDTRIRHKFAITYSGNLTYMNGTAKTSVSRTHIPSGESTNGQLLINYSTLFIGVSIGFKLL